jgi:membrane protein implicated in regulation of membrane protease activity
MHKSYWLLFAVAALLLQAGIAAAYVGPGAGISLVGSLFGLLSAVVIAIGVVLLWPIRRIMRRIKGSAEPEQAAEAPTDRSE